MVVSIDKNTFCLVGDVLLLLERAATEAIQPTTDDKVADPLAARNAQVKAASPWQEHAVRPPTVLS